MTGLANFSVFRGDTFLKTTTLRNKTTNTPVNLTGATVSGTVGSTSLTGIIIDAVNGKFTFGLNTTQTAALKAGTLPITVKITFADLTVKTLFTGNVVVK